ncbi:uncharacterized protein LOC116301519 [Actinia tenebrosa]|uniref:Uncharacterized protein LOC116301519 n=1 Tax=Actinia tenebrosa TaxID=6105 RepID=A0A6P8IHZ9_ACTTE|nr:uncharacterized protein LOC116301519 [Actinia tenebrosa]
MSILDVNFEAIGESSRVSSAPSTPRVDNVEHFILADFENYCNPTERNTEEKPQLVNTNSDETTDILTPEELSENLDGGLNVNQQLWLDNSRHTKNEALDNALNLSPSLYSNNNQVPIQMDSEGQHYLTIKDSNSAAMESPTKISWSNIPIHPERSSEYMVRGGNHFPSLHGTVNTSVLEKARPISSTWSDPNDHEVANYLAEVVTVPQVYSQAQPNHLRVELGNDGQQYMIVDGKYFSENAQDMGAFQLGSNNQYYLTGTQLMAEYPTISHSAATQSTSTASASACTLNVINQMGIFQNYNENETEVIDKDVLEEQKRKEQMQIRRREKNKDCSRAFRRNQKEKERKLREGRIEKQARLKELNKKNDNFIRMLSKAALQGCEKAKGIAATSMETWNKENNSFGGLSANM